MVEVSAAISIFVLLYICTSIVCKNIFHRNKGGRCNECHHFDNHSPLCENQTLVDAKKNAKHYYLAWLHQVDRSRRPQARYLKQIVFWQGKFNTVKHENNKLRKKLYENY